MTKQGCVVVSIHKDKENLDLVTNEGIVEIELTPISNTRTKVVIRAPLAVQVLRRKKGAKP